MVFSVVSENKLVCKHHNIHFTLVCFGSQVDLQQQVQGMGAQLASLEASLKASDAQAGNLQQQLASLGNTGPQAFKVNGQHMNGSASPNLPKGYYYTLADLAPASAPAQEAAAQKEPPSAELAEEGSGTEVAAAESEEHASITEEMLSTASAGSANASTAGRSEEEEKELNKAPAQSDGNGAVSQSSSSSIQQRAAQPGIGQPSSHLCSHSHPPRIPQSALMPCL